MTLNTAGVPELCDGVEIDVPRLLKTRMLIQANSGGGKSYTLRRVIEQTANSVQQLIIDPDGEFSSLREKFDYVICAPAGADAIAKPHTAHLLARRLLESGVSAVLDIYELEAGDRRLFVQRFLESLISAPKMLWHPCLVVLDEAQLFAPEKGAGRSRGNDQAGCTRAVIDIATRGRKRGFGLIMATQRLSKLNKDAAAEMINKLIGRTGLDVDVKRAAEDLGMPPREAMASLRDLNEGEFYVFGPAFPDVHGMQKIRTGRVVTTHPEPGVSSTSAPPAASQKIRSILAELEDIETEAEEEADTLAAMQAEIADLKAALRRAESAKPAAAGPTEEEIKRHVDAQVAKVIGEYKALDHTETLQQIARLATEAANKPPPRTEYSPMIANMKARSQERVTTGTADITGPMQKILDAIAWLGSLKDGPYDKRQIAFVAGYKPNGGGFNNPLSALSTAQLITRVGTSIDITIEGRGHVKQPPAALTNTDLHQRVFEKLNGPQRRILTPLIECWPHAMTRNQLAESSGYTAGAGGFNNPLSSLSTLGLVTYPEKGTVRADPCLFPKG